VPGEELLPPAIKAICGQNAAEVRSGPEFRQRLRKLVAEIELVMGSGTLMSWLRSNVPLWKERQ